MPLSTEQQKLLDFALGSLPSWYQEALREYEFDGACAVLFNEAREALVYWFSQALITQAVGAIASDPDWLNQHAIDRGTGRQANETDDALRFRIRNTPDALTRPLLLAEVATILDDAGVVGSAAMVELRRDRAFVGLSLTADVNTTTGGTFTDESSVANPDRVGFTPNTPFVYPPFREPEEELNHKLVFTNATNANNNGTFPVLSLEGNMALFDNAPAVFGADAVVDWEARRYDRDNNLLTGRKASYVGRGYRMGSQAAYIIVILPFGTDAATADSVAEALRQKKAAGVQVIVERRTSP